MARAWPGVRRAARVALYVLLGLILLLALLLVALRTSFAREQARTRINSALGGLFRGRVEIERLGAVTLGGVSGVDARVFDANGEQVIRVQGLSVEASLLGLGWQFVAHGARPELALAAVHIDDADVALRDDAELGVSLASTFLPRTPSATTAGAPASGPALRIARATFRHVWAHGQLGSSPVLDGELTQMVAALSQSPEAGFSLNLRGVELVTRGLPGGVQPRGRVTGLLVAPADARSPLRLEGKLSGSAASSPLALEASWVGDALRARVDLPRLPASFVNAQVPALRLDGDVALHAELSGDLPLLDVSAALDAAGGHVQARGYAAVAEGLELAATLEASGVDAARILPDAPASELDLRLEAFAFEQGDGDFVVAHRLDVSAGRIAGNTTPPLWLGGQGHLDAAGKLTASGRVAVKDAGLSLRGGYHVVLPADAGGVVAANLQAELDDPARLAELGVQATGHAELSGALGLPAGSLTGTAALSLRHLNHTLVQARNVELLANASGTLAQPQLHAAATLDVLSGRAHADLDYSKTRQALELFVSDVDLIRFSNIVGSKLPLEQATLGGKLCVTRQAPAAHFQLDGTVEVALGKLGATQMTATALELPNAWPRGAQWSQVQGDLLVNGSVHLEELSPLLTRLGLPIERTTGELRFEVASQHRRGDPQGLELSVALGTTGLRVVQQRTQHEAAVTTADAVANQPLAIEGIDLHFSAHARPSTGETFGTLLVRDSEGTLADLQAEAQLAQDWPSRLAYAAALARVPLKASLEVSDRKLAKLPPWLGLAGLRGRVSLQANLDGSLAEPQLLAKLSAQSLHAAATKEPVDLDAELHYTPAGGQCRVNAKLARQTSQVAKLDASWQGDLHRAGMLTSGASGLVANADAEVADFPLETWPLVADHQISGRLSGKVSLKNWGQAAQLDATIQSTSLSLGKLPIRELRAAAQTRTDQVSAELSLKVGTGTAHASLSAGMRWGERVLPELTHRGHAELEAQAFDLASLAPILAGYVSELGGVLDAKTELVVTPTTTELSGSAKLEKGVVQLPALGQQLSDISARIAVAGQKLKLEDFTARGTTGRVTGHGSASLDGFDLRAAEAHLTIDKREPLPLTLEGAALGDVSGKVDAVYASPPSGSHQLDITLPVLRLVTPDASSYDVQGLDVPDDIRVGVQRADGTFITLPTQPLSPGSESAAEQAASAPLRIRVRLGQDVVVERGTTAKVQLGGELQVEIGAQTAVNGRIEVRGGKLDVSGKTFDIERGVVAFDGDDPGNPTITATARWDAPEYTVYADYVGDVKNGRIRLRSEPPLTPSEIANLLLFGSAEGSAVSNGDPNTAALAVGLAGDTAAKGLNQVLDDFTKLDVSARVDTTTGSARPELVFQVSPRVSARVTRAIGAPVAGQAEDRTFLTLELRLKRAWALSAVFGDHGGSALDLIWRRRY